MNAPVERPEIDGLKVGAEIGRGARSVVYEAYRDGERFAVKVQRTGGGSDGETVAAQFRREALSMAQLRNPALPRIMEVGEWRGRAFLVMEHVAGQTLREVLRVGALGEGRAVSIALSVAGALRTVHEAGLVHRDIKPANVLETADGDIKLIDFGFVTSIKETAEGDELVGTFLYAPPEQTGMLDRPVDQRADLYSLGAVLFEMLTGRPPFLAEDGGELVRKHAAVQAPDVRDLNPRVSPALAKVVERLLSKDPDDRYGSAASLCRDLGRLDELNAAFREGRTVELAAVDGSGAVSDQPVLVGRDAELARLHAELFGALAGRGRALLLEGPSGTGVSSLAAALIPETRERGATVLQGRGTEGGALPFAIWRQLLEGYLAELGRGEPEARERALDALRQAASGQESSLAAVSLTLAETLGSKRSTGAAPGEGAGGQERFYDVVADLVVTAAHSEVGALILLDDLQWIDESGIKILSRVARRLNDLPVLILGTLRSEGRWRERVEQVATALGSSLSARLRVKGLDQRGVAALLQHMLGADDLPEGLVEDLRTRTGGNPLALRESVKAMLELGVLQPSWDGWTVDQHALETMDLPADVLELVMRRAENLSEEALEALRWCGIEQSVFDEEDIALLGGMNRTPLTQALEEARKAGLVRPVGQARWEFVHPRVREAVLRSLGDERRKEMHQRAAEMLDADCEDGSETLFGKAMLRDVASWLYRVARHYARGQIDKRPDRVMATNLAAGRRALEEYAAEEAYRFLKTAHDTAAAMGEPDSPEVLELFSEACVRTGRAQEAFESVERTIAASTVPWKRAGLRWYQAGFHMTHLDADKAWEQVTEAWKDLGRPWPRTLPGAIAATAWDLVRALFSRSEATGEERERMQTMARLHEVSATVAFVDNRLGMGLQVVLRSLLPARRLGPSREQVVIYSGLACLLAVPRWMGRVRRLMDQVRETAHVIGDPMSIGFAYLYRGWAESIAGNLVEAERRLIETCDEHGAGLFVSHYQHAGLDLAWNQLLRGYARRARERVTDSLQRWDDVSDRESAHAAQVFRYFDAGVCAVLGQPTEGRRHLERSLEIVPLGEGRGYVESERLGFLILYYAESGQLGEELEDLLRRLHERGLNPRFSPHHLQACFLYAAWARRAQWRTALREGRDPGRALESFRDALRRLAATRRYALFDAYHAVLTAELDAAEERFGSAEAALERAERLAADLDAPLVEAEVAAVRARIASAKGREEPARRWAVRAVESAEEIGWGARARIMRAELGVESRESSSLSGSGGSVSASMSRISSHLKRQRDALLQVALASSTVLEPEGQARAVLDEIVRVMGAERAFLLLQNDGNAPLELRAGRTATGDDLKELRGYSTTVVERVRVERRPMVLSGTDEGEAMGARSVVAHDLRSIAAVPLTLRDRFVGVLYLDNRLARGMFGRDDLELLGAVAAHLPVILETARTARLETRLGVEKEQRVLADRLRDINLALGQSLEPEEVLSTLLRSLRELVPWDRAAAWLDGVDGIREPLSLPAGVEVANPDAIVEEIRSSLRPVLVQDRSEDSRLGGVGAWLGVPLASRGELVAVAVLECDEVGALGSRERDLAETVAGQAGAFLANARLFAEVRRLATVDPLTGINNRRRFFELAEAEIKRARRFDHGLGALMLDVDHFKAVNDGHGHAAGDDVLKAVAERLQRELREVDTLGRYGGEEFAVVLPEVAGPEELRDIGERVRAAVAAGPVETVAGPISVTTSVGAALLLDGDELSSMLQRADAGLYEAKEQGRNRVVVTP